LQHGRGEGTTASAPTAACSNIYVITELDSARLKHTRGRSGPGYQEHPEALNNLNHDILQQQHIEEFMPNMKQLQNRMKMSGSSSGYFLGYHFPLDVSYLNVGGKKCKNKKYSI